MGSSKRSPPAGPADDLEAGVARFDYNFGVRHFRAVGTKTPRGIVNRLHQETARALDRKRCGTAWKARTPNAAHATDEFERYIRNEIKTMRGGEGRRAFAAGP